MVKCYSGVVFSELDHNIGKFCMIYAKFVGLWVKTLAKC